MPKKLGIGSGLYGKSVLYLLVVYGNKNVSFQNIIVESKQKYCLETCIKELYVNLSAVFCCCESLL